jgi:hypothetical protein
MRKSVRQGPTAGEKTQQKAFRPSADIRAELENHTVGRGQKGLKDSDDYDQALLFTWIPVFWDMTLCHRASSC